MEQQRQRYSIHREAEYARLQKKTREHELVDRLERGFEFSPRESHGVLEVGKENKTILHHMNGVVLAM